MKTAGRRAGRAERDDHVMPVSDDQFTLPFVKEGEWLILQFNEKDGDEVITVRVQYEKDAFFGHDHWASDITSHR